MPKIHLQCPVKNCGFQISSFNTETNLYRLWFPNPRKHGKHLFTGPVRVRCVRCLKPNQEQWIEIPKTLDKPITCPKHRIIIAHKPEDDFGIMGAIVDLKYVGNEIFCTNADVYCQKSGCRAQFNLETLRLNGGDAYPFDTGVVVHLRDPK